jgi:chemotaxis signal transduction protein
MSDAPASPADDALDLLLETPAEPATPLLRAQAIDCGSTSVAVPYGWARTVIEDFVITPAPNAPIWLVGAFNAEGHILPVVDFAAWLDETAVQPIGRGSRLLLGGEGQDRFALLFQGLPVMVRYIAGNERAPDTGLRTLAAYTVAVAAVAGSDEAREWPVIDARALGEDCFAELAA